MRVVPLSAAEFISEWLTMKIMIMKMNYIEHHDHGFIENNDNEIELLLKIMIMKPIFKIVVMNNEL